MSEVNNKNMYLDLKGLQKYDELIKQFIETQDENVIAALNDILGDFNGSDDKMTVADIIAGVTKRVTDVEEAVDKLGDLGDGNTLGDLVSDITANTKAIETLTGEDEGSVKKAAADTLAAAKAHADGLLKDAEGKSLFDAAGSAAAAETAAKAYADELNGAMNERVAALEEIDHNHVNKDVLDGISAEKVAAWDAAEQNAKDYVDDLVKDAEGNVKFDAAGAAATAEQNAKAHADGLVKDAEGKSLFDAAGSAAAAQAAAEATAAADATTKANDAQAAAEKKATDLNTAMDSRVVAIEGKVDSWDAAAGRINTFLDSEEVDTTVDTLHEIQAWMNGEGVDATDLTAAIAAEAKLREDADKATDKAINDKIGTVTEGKTVVGMIGDAQTAAVTSAKSYTDEREVAINAALDEKATVVALNALGGRVDEDITNLNNHMTEAAAKIAEVDGRLDDLENASIKIEYIEGLFVNSESEA